MIKTKKYKLLDYRITVKYVKRDSAEDGHWIYGHTHYVANDILIVISTESESGKAFTEDELNITLRHELFHVVLAKLYFDDSNETLVEWLAQATQILNKQGLRI